MVSAPDVSGPEASVDGASFDMNFSADAFPATGASLKIVFFSAAKTSFNGGDAN